MTRNPYLLLGVDYGTPVDAARRAFARAAERVRRARDSDVTVEELNHALHEVQTADGDPFDQVEHFRVPADPALFTPSGSGVLNPPPVPLARTNGPQDPVALRPDAAREMGEVLDAVVAATVTFDYGYVFQQGGTNG